MAEDKSTSEDKFEEFKQSLNSGGEVETGEEDETSNQDEGGQDEGQSSEEGNTSDDSSNDDSEEGSDESDTSGKDGNEEEESGNTEEPQSQLEKSYSQFDVDGTDEGYLKRLERAYQKSSEEAIRLNHENQNLKNGQPVQAPQTGQNDQGQQGQQGQQNQQPAASAQGEDPVVVHMRTQMNQQADKDLAEFRKDHPEIDTDPEIRENVNNYIKFYSQYSYQNEGRLPGMKESLEAAYKHFGYGDDKEEKVANQTKQNASQSKTGSKPKPGSGKKESGEMTDLEKQMAQKMGRDPEKVKKQKQQAS